MSSEATAGTALHEAAGSRPTIPVPAEFSASDPHRQTGGADAPVLDRRGVAWAGAARVAIPISSCRSDLGIRDPEFLTWAAIRDYREPASATPRLGSSRFRADAMSPTRATRSMQFAGLRIRCLRRCAKHSAFPADAVKSTRGKGYGQQRFAVRLDSESEDPTVRFAFSVASGESEALCVVSEDCLVKPRDPLRGDSEFSVRSSRVTD